MQLSQAVMKLTEDVVRFRRELHKIPELGLEEFKRQQKIKYSFKALGQEHVGKKEYH